MISRTMDNPSPVPRIRRVESRFDPGITVENHLEIAGGYAEALIPHFDMDVITSTPGSQGDLAAARGVLHRIVDEVGEGPDEPHRDRR